MQRNFQRRVSGFTLIELLVVISIIAVLATMLMPLVSSSRERALRLDCANNLRQVVISCQTYFDGRRTYPWCKPLSGGDAAGTISEESEALQCLELLYKYDYLQDPRCYLCRAAEGRDQAASPIDDLKERQQQFTLQPNECSFTYRNKLTTVNDLPTTPIAADKRGPETSGGITNHRSGRNVAFLGGPVEFYEIDKLTGDGREAKIFRKELVGFGK